MADLQGVTLSKKTGPPSPSSCQMPMASQLVVALHTSFHPEICLAGAWAGLEHVVTITVNSQEQLWKALFP